MKTTIFYFSAAGNSLDFARNLANRLNAQQFESIPERLESNNTYCASDCIGIVFPVYAWGLPRIVLEFLEKLEVRDKPYIFAITTCVGIPGNTLKTAGNILGKRNLELHAGFVVKAPCSSLAKKNFLDHIIIGLDRKKRKLRSGEERIDEIVSAIELGSKHHPETSSWPANYFGSIFHEYGMDFFKKVSEEFEVSDKCTGCGTCVRVCPRANIVLKDGQPRFSNNCEFCHACIQWCPEFAITHKSFSAKPIQYRNENVKLKDMIVNA